MIESFLLTNPNPNNIRISVQCRVASAELNVYPYIIPGQSAPRSGPQILVKRGGCPAKYCQVESNIVSELNVSYRNMVWGNISRIVKGFHMVIVN